MYRYWDIVMQSINQSKGSFEFAMPLTEEEREQLIPPPPPPPPPPPLKVREQLHSSHFPPTPPPPPPPAHVGESGGQSKGSTEAEEARRVRKLLFAVAKKKGRAISFPYPLNRRGLEMYFADGSPLELVEKKAYFGLPLNEKEHLVLLESLPKPKLPPPPPPPPRPRYAWETFESLSTGSSSPHPLPRWRPLTEEEQQLLYESDRRPVPLQPPPPQPPVVDLAIWPPVWKPLEESPQFQFGWLQPYLQLEDSLGQKCTESAYFGNSHNLAILKFLQQVRKSRGFNLHDCPYPEMFHGFPLRQTLFKVLMEDPENPYSKHMSAMISFVIDKINDHSMLHGIAYEFKRIHNVVDVGCARSTLLTLYLAERKSDCCDCGLKVAQVIVFGTKHDDFQILGYWFQTSDELDY